MTGTNPLRELSEHGQSVWLDNLSRKLIESGELSPLGGANTFTTPQWNQGAGTIDCTGCHGEALAAS